MRESRKRKFSEATLAAREAKHEDKVAVKVLKVEAASKIKD